MAVYAVGDIQGCYDPLARLLDRVKFDPSKDKLYCVGDLVNRGEQSLEVLCLLKSLKKQCVAVLGNHDLHLLACVYGRRKEKSSDTLKAIIDSPQVNEYAKWLRKRPLLYVDKKRNVLLCHAGIYPRWKLKQAISLAQDVEDQLRRKSTYRGLIKHMYGNQPNFWSEDLAGFNRSRFVLNSYTRMRFCNRDGSLDLVESGGPHKSTRKRKPWFVTKGARKKKYRIVYGHWSAAGFYNQAGFLGLDSGYVWGRSLTMVRLRASLSVNKPIAKKDVFQVKAKR